MRAEGDLNHMIGLLTLRQRRCTRPSPLTLLRQSSQNAIRWACIKIGDPPKKTKKVFFLWVSLSSEAKEYTPRKEGIQNYHPYDIAHLVCPALISKHHRLVCTETPGTSHHFEIFHSSRTVPGCRGNWEGHCMKCVSSYVPWGYLNMCLADNDTPRASIRSPGFFEIPSSVQNNLSGFV